MAAAEEARWWAAPQETGAVVEGALNQEEEVAEWETEVVKEAEKGPKEGEAAGPGSETKAAEPGACAVEHSTLEEGEAVAANSEAVVELILVPACTCKQNPVSKLRRATFG